MKVDHGGRDCSETSKTLYRDVVSRRLEGVDFIERMEVLDDEYCTLNLSDSQATVLYLKDWSSPGVV
jgi:hypothetical protein